MTKEEATAQVKEKSNLKGRKVKIEFLSYEIIAVVAQETKPGDWNVVLQCVEIDDSGMAKHKEIARFISDDLPPHEFLS